MSSFFRSLDDILGTKAKVRLLRALLGRDGPVSGRQAARLAGIAQNTAVRALDELAEVGVVEREVSPAEHHFTVNRRHYLVKHGLTPLYRAEERGVDAVFDELQRLVSELALDEEAEIVSGMIFGSVAREEDRPESDVDLLIVVAEEERLDTLGEAVTERTKRLRSDFGLKVSPMVLSLARLREMRAEDAPLAIEVEKEGRRVFGQHVSELLNGQA